MKLHKLTPKGYAVTELPEGADNDSFEITKWGALYYYTGVSPNHCGEEFKLPPGNWTVLGFAQDLTEDQWKLVVEQYPVVNNNRNFYKNYGKQVICKERPWVDTATESGHSAVKKAGLFVSNPHGEKSAVLNTDGFENADDWIKRAGQWQAAQLLTNPLILIKE